ncbi:MAG TPA: hypothetical protein VD931_03555, partial [Baekduia sp.]|nr:hypothetical protein [Baekduia sp.]
MSAAPAFVSVARRADLPALRLLAADLAVHHPGARLQALLLPGLGPRPRSDEPFDVVTASDAGLRELGRLLAEAPPAALEALVRPLALLRVLDTGAPMAVLLAADSQLLAPLTELTDELEQADAVVVPRLLGVLPDDGRRPDAEDLLDHGELDEGLVGVRDTPRARGLLDWWIDRARDGARA